MASTVCGMAIGGLKWGTPFVIYWEFYDNDSTVPIVPRSHAYTQLHTFFHTYLTTAQKYVAEHPTATVAELSIWAANYFEKLS